MGKNLLKIVLLVSLIAGIVSLVIFVKSHLLSSVVVYLAIDSALRFIIRSKRFLLLGAGILLGFFIVRKTWKFLKS